MSATRAELPTARELAALHRQARGGCRHPPGRLFAWEARDDTARGGAVFCIGCSACGAVVRGGAQLSSESEGEVG